MSAADIGAQLAALLGTGGEEEPTRAVAKNDEFDRIVALPRRRWSEDDPEILKLAEDMTVWLKTPHGTQKLRPAQAVALAELYHYKALFGMLRVGAGKTLVSFLVATILGATRAVLVVPAKLRKKTIREFEELHKHWRGPAVIRIISYEELSRDYGRESIPEGSNPATTVPLDTSILGMQNPEVIILEEGHRAKDIQSACTKKIAFHMRRHPRTIVVPLSGTFTKRSVNDYKHMLFWALKGKTPFPRGYHTQKEWAGALDEKVRNGERLDPGALVELATEEDWVNPDGTSADPTTAARRGYRRRLTETPGVVAYSKNYDGASLLIEEFPEPKYSAVTEQAFKDLRTEAKRPAPDGTPVDNGMDTWRISRQLALGYFGIWDPWPPEEWRFKRRAWGAAMRDILGGNPWRLDSEFQVALLCSQPPAPGDTPRVLEAKRVYAEWAMPRGQLPAVRDTFTANYRPVWIDDAPLEAVAKWMANNKGLVWVEHVDFAERLSKLTGAPYFGEQGEDARGREVESARPDRDGSIILSIDSNIEGRNLQTHWSDNLVTTSIKGGDRAEQLAGRTHREGQNEDEVTIRLLFGCRENLAGWLQNLADCTYQADSAIETAKLLTCDKNVPTDWAELDRRAPTSTRYW